MHPKTTRVKRNSQVQTEAANDTPLYAIFQNGEWFFVDEEIFADMIDQVSPAADDDQDAQQTYIDINEPL